MSKGSKEIEVSFMGVPSEVRLSKGAVRIIREAEAVGVDPKRCIQVAFKASVDSGRGQHSPPKIGPFGAGELPFSGLRASIDSRRADLARDTATSRRGR